MPAMPPLETALLSSLGLLSVIEAGAGLVRVVSLLIEDVDEPLLLLNVVDPDGVGDVASPLEEASPVLEPRLG
jgi:hypothetical protein